MRYLVAFQEVVKDSFMRPKLQNVFSSRERHPKTSANKDFGFDFSTVETRDHTATLTSPKWVISLSALNKCWSQRRKNKTLWETTEASGIRSSKNKTVWKWNILLSIKRWANRFWKWVKCEVWTSMVVYGNSGANVFFSRWYPNTTEKKLKTVYNVHMSKNKMKVRQVLIRREDALLHSSSSAPQNSLANRSVTPRCPSQLNMNGRSSPPTQQGHNI